MASQASNFAYQTARAWETGGTHAEHNAVTRAKTSGAIHVGPVETDQYIHERGDIPASLWRWPDGSTYVVFDDGSGIHAARKRGRQPASSAA